MGSLRLMAVLAHPDDESLGIGGTLAKYSAEGVETSLVTATRGQSGRYYGHRRGQPEHPGPEALGRIRESELHDAAAALGVREVSVLDYGDGALDGANPGRIIAEIVGHLRRARPHVVVTFAPDGAYGHPDHIAISQFAQAAIVAAADSTFDPGKPTETAAVSHAVSKLYYIAWPRSIWTAYEAAFRQLIATVDGVDRQTTPWPDWSITTMIDARAYWQTVWRAVSCHRSQTAAYDGLRALSAASHEALWGSQSFYRAFSLVNGGRRTETDLFEGLRA
jgi:LmbE family N-acetylglucosaminyl deacetylase